MTTNKADIPDIDLVSSITQGDQIAFNSLLSRYLPVIRYYCKKYFAPALLAGDLNQAGCIGLFVACKKYNPCKGMSFASFAQIHIKHHIINAVKTALRKKQQILNQSISLDEPPFYDQERISRYELIPDYTPSPEEIYMNLVNEQELRELFTVHLTDLERKAVWGLLDGLAYKEIAHLSGVGNKSIDNALKRAKEKLKNVLHYHV